ncbi:MAG: tRNA 4-thiouridine(8) synthase ThiI [Desulfobacteraceae bacterium]|nr:tRNA 4-thiouridine(8) synthase ThiI [Desulfobacteraceae bacterium]
MNQKKITRQVKALGLCSGGLDSILSALVLKKQGIDVTWISFETPFFSARDARKASQQTGIPLLTRDITKIYMEMIKAPKAGFGKNMNPCMDCHTLMFTTAGAIMEEEGFDFLFSGEVLGQRPKSQNKNALRYVEKNSGFDGNILRPLSAKCLPETTMEQQGLVDREQLLNINGRSRKIQMQMAKEFGIENYPSPAGGCLLTDIIFSNRLRDLLWTQKTDETRQLHLLKFGRHFRLDDGCKFIVGRSANDNQNIRSWYDKSQDIRLQHSEMAGPDGLLIGNCSDAHIKTAAQILAGYTKSKPGETAKIKVIKTKEETIIQITTQPSANFKDLMI